MTERQFSAVCGMCGNLTKVPFVPDGVREVYCHECLEIKRGESELSQAPKDFQKSFRVKLDEPGQVLSALNAVGEAFRDHGGATLMLTEHVENGIDAVEDLKYEHQKQNKKSDNPGKIDIIIDEKNSMVLVIDNGTGIIDPIWIMENPLKSRKTGESHQHGEFGRGLQGFRGFCDNLEYVTKREKISVKEQSDPDISKWIDEVRKSGLDGRVIRLQLHKDTINTIYKPASLREFQKYTDSSTGTVAIFSNWSPEDFQSLVTDKQRLFDRVQHHFRVPLEKGIVKISLKIGNNKPTPIEPRSFSIDGEEMDLFDLPDNEVINPYTKQRLGVIQYRLYQAAPRYQHRYKSPFLLVGDRPLGNSELLKLEELSEEKILKSPYITGYITANFLRPDSLRLSPKRGEEFTQFILHVRAALRRLKPMLEQYEEGFRVVDKQAENQKLILQVQSFVKDLKIPLDLLDTNKTGDLFDGMENGNNKDQRVSSIPGQENQGRIDRGGSVKVVVLHKKNKRNGDGGGTGGTKRFEVTYVDPKKGGRSPITVHINPKLTSRDGRIRKMNYVGPGLDNYRGDLDPNISKWDASKYLVLINELHPVYKEYEDQRLNSKYKDDAYSQRQKNLIQECYLWNLIKYCAKEKDMDVRERIFWEAKYKFFIRKDNT